METTGATKTFRRSVEKHRLYYTSFYRDSDSKSYPAVKEVYKDDNRVSQNMKALVITKKEWAADFVN